MTISIYDLSVGSYLQTLGGVASVLQKGADYAAENNLDLEELVETRLHPDMLPFHFQVISVFHHSLGAINGIKEGIFTPPPSMPELDYGGLKALVENAATELQAMSSEGVNALGGKAIMFKAGKFEVPFTTENFLLSFSLPNLYFHAATTYNILRVAGVPLGKMDFLGQLRVGA